MKENYMNPLPLFLQPLKTLPSIIPKTKDKDLEIFKVQADDIILP